MFQFKPLSIEDKEIFDRYVRPYSFLTCEYSFINLFIWRKGCDIQYTIYDDVLIIKKLGFDGKYYFMQPLGYSRKKFIKLIDELVKYRDEQKLDYLFKDAETPFIKDLKDAFPGRFIIEADRNNFDYIYTSRSLLSLSGNNLSKKRNHCNHFVKNNLYRIEFYSPEVKKKCMDAAKQWCNKKEYKSHALYELEAVEDLLDNAARLDFQCMLVYVNNIPSAFSIGEKVNDSMAIIHVEKADSSIRGLYAFINRKFIEIFYKDVPYINREQDLGIEGLRQSKLSYCPYKLEPKYSVK